MKYRIAVGTKDKVNVTEHFGQCRQFLIIDIEQENDEAAVVGERCTVFSSQCGEHQDEKIRHKINVIKDCQIVLVKQIGGQSEKLLNHNGIIALQYQGSIEEALAKIKKAYKKQKFPGTE
jgi:predicted Fe-Mo cluster-binding NifX family protein